MPQACSICVHGDRAAIEGAHVEGISLRGIAAKFARTSPWSLRRHFAHVPALIASVRAHQVAKNETSAKLPARLEALILEAQLILAAAKTEKRWIVAIAALRENRHMLELLGRLTGELRGFGAGEFVPGTGATAAATATASASVTMPVAPEKNPEDLVRLLKDIYHLSSDPPTRNM
jgi:hypothetical protein